MRNYHGVSVLPILVDKNNNIKKTFPVQKNLVLDVGLDRVATTPIAGCLARCVIGTGTAPTNRGTQGFFVQKIGAVVTAEEPFFENDDALFNRVLQLSNGVVCRILSVDSSTRITVSETETPLVNGAAIVWNVEQTTLNTQLNIDATINTSKSTFNGTTVNDPTIEGVRYLDINRFRTFQFDFEDESHTITEAGWTWDVASVTPQLFGRVVFGTPINITPHDRLLIKVIFNHKFAIPAYVDNDPYFSASGTWDVGTVKGSKTGISYISPSGGIVTGNAYLPMLEPCEDTLVQRFVGSENSTLSKNAIGSSYSNGSYKRSWPPFAISDDFETSIERIEYGSQYWYDPAGETPGSYVFVNMISLEYAVPQYKPAQTTMTSSFQVSWDRKLPAFPV